MFARVRVCVRRGVRVRVYVCASVRARLDDADDGGRFLRALLLPRIIRMIRVVGRDAAGEQLVQADVGLAGGGVVARGRRVVMLRVRRR
eukprot:91000-Pleurochrysis_carterae.AAC.1